MLKILVNLIFPPKCIFCGCMLETASLLDCCCSCYRKIPFLHGRFMRGQACKSFFDDVICACEYSGIIKAALVKYKFGGKSGYHRTFARILSKKVKEMTSEKDFDIMVCIPLHHKREAERGYNQSLLIAKALSRQTGIAFKGNVLKRIENTCSQSLLDRKERLGNVKGAFICKNADIINNKNVLLIDDIFTTGATVSECSRILKEAGANRVVVAVVASGRKY